MLTAALHPLSWRLPGTLTALAPRDETVLASRVRLRASGIRLGLRDGAVVLGSGHPWPPSCARSDCLAAPLVTTIVEHVAFEKEPVAEISR